MTKLELAEAYYTVARDLEENAQEQMRMAKLLNQCADMICGQNMHESSQSRFSNTSRNFR